MQFEDIEWYVILCNGIQSGPFKSQTWTEVAPHFWFVGLQHHPTVYNIYTHINNDNIHHNLLC